MLNRCMKPNWSAVTASTPGFHSISARTTTMKGISIVAYAKIEKGIYVAGLVSNTNALTNALAARANCMQISTTLANCETGDGITTGSCCASHAQKHVVSSSVVVAVTISTKTISICGICPKCNKREKNLRLCNADSRSASLSSSFFWQHLQGRLPRILPAFVMGRLSLKGRPNENAMTRSKNCECRRST